MDIADFVQLHVMEKSSKETTEETLKWVHITLATPKEILFETTTKLKESISTLPQRIYLQTKSKIFWG